MKRNIVYIWDADYPWDVRTEKVCATLNAADYRVQIVARNRKWEALTEDLPEGRVHRMRPWRLLGHFLDNLLSFPAFFSPRWLVHIDRTVRKKSADLIIVRDLPLCPSAIVVGKLRGVPVLFDMAENYPAMMQEIWDAKRHRITDVLVRNPRIVRMVERWCLPRVAGVLTVVSESAERVAELGAPAHRVAVVSNTPRARTMHPRRQGSGPLKLVYLGLLEIPRGVGELIDATRIARDAGISVQLTIIGDGRDRDLLEQRAQATGLGSEVIRFTGRVPYAEALAMVASADVGVVPHHADEAWNTTIPNKLFDYMAAGLPVITSDARPAARIIKDTNAGIVFRSADTQSLAQAIIKLANPQLRMRMGEAGRNSIRTRYNWEVDAGRLLRLVNELIPRKSNIRGLVTDPSRKPRLVKG